MLHELIVFRKTYEFLFWLKPTVERFSKTHKYSLGIKLENEALALLQGIIRANGKKDKSFAIEECRITLETVRILLRLAKDFKLVNLKQYEFSAEKLEEIGRLLGGWQKRFGEK
jgi:hypothetical protein